MLKIMRSRQKPALFTRMFKVAELLDRRSPTIARASSHTATSPKCGTASPPKPRNLFAHRTRRRLVAAGALARRPEVIDDDARSATRELERLDAPKTTRRSGDDRYFSV
jgi:hypothetical protein